MKEDKKVWIKPELIGLVRNNHEQSVLVTCKRGDIVAAGSYEVDSYCYYVSCTIPCDSFAPS